MRSLFFANRCVQHIIDDIVANRTVFGCIELQMCVKVSESSFNPSLEIGLSSQTSRYDGKKILASYCKDMVLF